MKINSESPRNLGSTDVVSTNKTTANQGAKSTSATTSTSSIGSIKLSETSRSLSAGVSGAEAPFDAKKVDAIKSAIASGQFKVNPEAVADGILASASQLLVAQ